ncbi:MAG: response regulator [Clostridiales bacterium]|jgi:two-component system response regulator YesN|nr:response regulator [Clostridiales bacterium]
MLRVVLVEDEVLVREAIKKNVDWRGCGYAFCGEAPDGELAFELIREKRPDVVITDIRMPFMDGLTLARLVKDEAPDTKIILLTGHDDFGYIQRALRLGVSEYLLKPVSNADITAVLLRFREIIEKEREGSALAKRKADLEEIVWLKKRRFLEDWLSGRIAPGEIAERAAAVKTPLDAGAYALLLCEFEDEKNAKRAKELAALFAEDESVACFPWKDGGAAIIVMADDPEQADARAEETADYLSALWGSDGSAAFSATVRAAANSLAGVAANRADQTYPGKRIPAPSAEPAPQGQHDAMLARAKAYIDERFAGDDVSLNAVAAHVNVSPPYFSALFKQLTGVTFIEYLTAARMSRAKELLRGTPMRASEIAYEVGYNDPHYFSYLFKKINGVTPSEYRRG